MLRHNTLFNHESCQTRINFFFLCCIFLIICLNSVHVVAQNLDNFQIKLKKIEYIDVNTKEHSYRVVNSTNNVLNLS